ncbi:MAG: N-acetyltransferase [Sphingobacteriales bacterium]|nr:MAG: N-acetyltransferase [Sphingobacteriales bacterium]
MQPENIHRWLSTESYWSKGIPFDVVKTAIDNSFCIGVLSQNVQIGFARLVTDYATFAYLADVYVVDEHRGQGLSKKMMELIMSLPWMGTLRRICLATVDAHGLYTKFGFQSPAKPDRLLEITRPMIYGDNSNI